MVSLQLVMFKSGIVIYVMESLGEWAGPYYFYYFFCVLFITFSYSTQLCTYDCIGTSGKKSRKPPWEGFVDKTTAEGIWLGTL